MCKLIKKYKVMFKFYMFIDDCDKLIKQMEEVYNEAEQKNNRIAMLIPLKTIDLIKPRKNNAERHLRYIKNM